MSANWYAAGGGSWTLITVLPDLVAAAGAQSSTIFVFEAEIVKSGWVPMKVAFVFKISKYDIKK